MYPFSRKILACCLAWLIALLPVPAVIAASSAADRSMPREMMQHQHHGAAATSGSMPMSAHTCCLGDGCSTAACVACAVGVSAVRLPLPVIRLVATTSDLSQPLSGHRPERLLRPPRA